MDRLYLRGVLSNLKPVLVEFDRQCQTRDIKYLILADEPSHQKFSISVEDANLISSMKAFAAKYKVVVEDSGRTLDFAYGSQHNDDGSYGLDLIDDDVRFKIGESVIGYLGRRHGPLIRESMQGLTVPIKKINTETLWKTHLNHPRYAELGDDKACYVGVIDDFPPLVVDTLDEDAPVQHAGVLMDGFRRLYASYYRQEPQVKAIDVSDVVKGVQGRIGIKLESQYKKIFNRKYSEIMDECNIGEVGKLKSSLVAHDNSTIIPKGTVVKVVDGDRGLPDIKYDGHIVNVDRGALEDAWKPATFEQQLESALVEGKEPEGEVEKSEFEAQISNILGIITITEPEVLFTIRPK